MDTFFKTIKAKLIGRGMGVCGAVEMVIFEDINGFYNPRRRHSTMGRECPIAFERIVA